MTVGFLDLTRVLVPTSGTGAVATIGATVAGFLSFPAAGAVDGTTYRYSIQDPNGQSEIGTGVYTAAGPSITRNPTKSTNGNNRVNLSGNAQLIICLAAEDMFITLGTTQMNLTQTYGTIGGPITWTGQQTFQGGMVISPSTIVSLGNSATLQWANGTGVFVGGTFGGQIFKFSDNNMYFDNYDNNALFFWRTTGFQQLASLGPPGFRLITGSMGINTGGQALTAQLVVAGQNGSAFPLFIAPTVVTPILLGIGQNGSAASIQLNSFAASNNFLIQRADGSLGSEAALGANVSIGSIAWRGYAGTAAGGYPNTNGAFIQVQTTNAWSATDQSTHFRFLTTVQGSIGNIVAMSVYGGVIFGTGTVDPGLGNIVLSGVANNSVLYSGGSGAAVAGVLNGTTTNKFLTQSSGNAPAWNTIQTSDLPAGTPLGFGTPVANSVNVSAPTAGTSSLAMRVDATLQIDQTIAPTWTGQHAFRLNNTQGIPFQIQVIGGTNVNQQLLIGYNTANNYGSIQAILQGTSTKPLLLNVGGGGVGIGGGSANVPLSTADIYGSLALGAYAGVFAAPANGIAMSGNLAIGASFGSAIPYLGYPLQIRVGTNQNFGVRANGTLNTEVFAATDNGATYVPLELNGLVFVYNSGGTIGMGIGAAPASGFALDVQGFIRSNAAGANQLIANTTGTAQQATLLFSEAGSGKWQMGKQTDNSFFIFDIVRGATAIGVNNVGVLALGETNNTILVPLTGSAPGNFGVNTVSPLSVMQINGRTSTTALTVLGTAAQIVVDSSGVGVNFIDGASTSFRPFGSGVPYFLLQNGIGQLLGSVGGAFLPQFSIQNQAFDTHSGYIRMQKARGLIGGTGAAVQVNDAVATFLFEGQSLNGVMQQSTQMYALVTAVGSASVSTDLHIGPVSGVSTSLILDGGGLTINDPTTTSIASMVLSAPSDINGANFRITGNGTATSSKYIRVASGVLQVVNNAYSILIWSLDDVGNMSCNGVFTATGPITSTGGTASIIWADRTGANQWQWYASGGTAASVARLYNGVVDIFAVAATGFVGVGAAPSFADSLLTVNGNTTTSTGTLPPGTIAHLIGANGTQTRMVMDSIGAGTNITLRRANGTLSAPTALLLGDGMGNIAIFGYTGSAYTSANRGALAWTASENWNGTANGTQLDIQVTPNGSTVAATVARIFPSGGVGLNNTTVDPGLGSILISGTYYSFPSGTVSGMFISQTSVGTTTSVAGVTGFPFYYLGSPFFVYNQIQVKDTLTVTGTHVMAAAFAVGMEAGGPNSVGSKFAFEASLVCDIPGANPAVARDRAAGNFDAYDSVGDGGTGLTGSSAKGTLFALGVQAVLANGATNVLTVSGGEINCGLIGTGASAYTRLGWSSIGIGVKNASFLDAAFEIGATTTGGGWKSGLVFTSFHGAAPVQTNGTLIGTDGVSFQAGMGIDFSFVNFASSGYFMRGGYTGTPGTGVNFSIDFAGRMSIFNTTGGNSATITGLDGGIWLVGNCTGTSAFNNGLRFFSISGTGAGQGSVIEGVDSTGVSAYRNFTLGGSTVSFTTLGASRAILQTSGCWTINSTTIDGTSPGLVVNAPLAITANLASSTTFAANTIGSSGSGAGHGFIMGWNFSSGFGEAAFINNINGGGSFDFVFYDWNGGSPFGIVYFANTGGIWTPCRLSILQASTYNFGVGGSVGGAVSSLTADTFASNAFTNSDPTVRVVPYVAGTLSSGTGWTNGNALCTTLFAGYNGPGSGDASPQGSTIVHSISMKKTNFTNTQVYGQCGGIWISIDAGFNQGAGNGTTNSFLIRGNTVNGSNLIKNVVNLSSPTLAIVQALQVTGTGFPVFNANPGAIILSVSGTTITMSINSTFTGSVTLNVFFANAGYGNMVSASPGDTFGIDGNINYYHQGSGAGVGAGQFGEVLVQSIDTSGSTGGTISYSVHLGFAFCCPNPGSLGATIGHLIGYQAIQSSPAPLGGVGVAFLAASGNSTWGDFGMGINGTAVMTIDMNGSIVKPSDPAMKRNIRHLLIDVRQLINDVDPVHYRWKHDRVRPHLKERDGHGFLAYDHHDEDGKKVKGLKEAFERQGRMDFMRDTSYDKARTHPNQKIWGFCDTELIPYLWLGEKKLFGEIDRIDIEIKELQDNLNTRVAQLETRVAELEAAQARQ